MNIADFMKWFYLSKRRTHFGCAFQDASSPIPVPCPAKRDLGTRDPALKRRYQHYPKVHHWPGAGVYPGTAGDLVGRSPVPRRRFDRSAGTRNRYYTEMAEDLKSVAREVDRFCRAAEDPCP